MKETTSDRLTKNGENNLGSVHCILFHAYITNIRFYHYVWVFLSLIQQTLLRSETWPWPIIW